MPETIAAPTVSDAVALGLTEDEYDSICDQHGRAPNRVELAMYSLLWSEHCAYKHTRKLLRTLPTEGRAVVMGPGENAGAVDIGSGLVCAFKVESHNHPSAVEPFQGAATGVGGILRDIFAVGARPIAVLDSLRFGEPSAERTRYLLDGAVAGIGHYGNSIGVANVGGEVYFEAPYQHSCLVHAMALGIAPRERLVRSAAAGPGNALILFGAATGRDGIGGASVLASAELDEGTDARRPTVQVGDPFQESKLLECSLALLDDELVVSLQDLGAAGLTSAAGEMAAKGSVGLDIDIDAVPLREADMEAFEIMVSESQERMLCVVVPEKIDAVLALCERWEVNGTVIGAVTDTGLIRLSAAGETVGEMPVAALVDGCPIYDLAPAKPTKPVYAAPVATLDRSCSPAVALLALLGSPNLASRRPLFEQYDCLVQSRTVMRPGDADAAVLVIEPGGEHRGGPGSGDARPAIAVSIDGNGRRVAADPYWGAVAAVVECAANLACTGAEVLGATDNLSFGNPAKPHVAWQLTESVRGLGDACRALETPIVGGNVSLYNDGPAGPIYPTPVVGMVGHLPDARRVAPIGFAVPGASVALVGEFAGSLGASELHKLWGMALPDGLAPIDLGSVAATHAVIREAVRAGTLSSAHDIAEGGLAVALAECCLAGGIGAQIGLTAADVAAGVAVPAGVTVPAATPDGAPGADTVDTWAVLFGEGAGGFLVSGPEDVLLALGETIAAKIIGTVGGDTLTISAPGCLIEVTVDEMTAANSTMAAMFA